MLLSEKAYDHAFLWIKDAVNSFPQETCFYTLFARYHKEQNRPYDAVGCLKRSLSINSSHVESMIVLAELYEEIKEYSDAILYYEKAIKLAPNDLKLPEQLKNVLKMKYGKIGRLWAAVPPDERASPKEAVLDKHMRHAHSEGFRTPPRPSGHKR